MNQIYLFFAKATNFVYSEPVSIPELIASDHKVIYLPLNIDTEFYHLEQRLDCPVPSAEIQRTLTVQVRGIQDPIGEIYTHPDSASIARHEVDFSPLSICNYLNSRNIRAKLYRADTSVRPDRYIRVDFHGFFLLAEVLRIAQGEMKRDIEKLIVHPGKNKVTMGRRLIGSNKSRGGTLEEQFIYSPNCIFEIEGIKFRLQIAYFDLCAIVGNTSYAELCEVAGHELKYKDTLTSNQKEKMQIVYTEFKEVFDNYALGDLEGYDALLKLDEKLKQIYTDLSIVQFYKPGESLRLTIGATVAKLFEASLMKVLGISDLKLLHSLTKPGTAETLKQNNDTSKYNAKVDGGRCRNNRPIDVSVKGDICDIDISGCYGEGLRVQEYPLGNPVQIGLPIKSQNNKYMSFGKFLQKYEHELVPGLWCIRISCKEGYTLKYAQDFLTSWFPPKNLDNLPTDSDLEAGEWWTDDNTGVTKILRNDIHLAVVTHDVLQLINNVASARQRKEILDNCVVVSAVYYPKSCRVNTLDELITALKNHRGKNTTTPKGKGKNTKVVKIEHECHAWMSINLGDTVITELLKKRNEYPKKTSFNTLYKLITNTVYGDQVSPYFPIGNTCVGNNITARARVMSYLMEKGVHGFQTITDGCAFDLNRIPYGERKRITSETLLDAYAKGTDEGNFKFKPLSETSLTDPVIIAEKVLEKLRNDFPGMDVLHQVTATWKGDDRAGQFGLEVKDYELSDKQKEYIHKGIATHGSANYVIATCEGFTQAKYRSHSKKYQEILDANLVVKIKEGKPAQTFLENLFKNPEAVPRGECFISRSILKPATYKQWYETIGENSPIFPGCTMERVRLIREFSLATFTFNTMEQYRSWEREWKKLLDHTGQSYESFYLNPDGTLNYLKMVRDIDARIRAGKMSYLGSRLSRYLSGELEGLHEHPAFATLKAAKASYKKIYGVEVSVDDVVDDLTDELD